MKTGEKLSEGRCNINGWRQDNGMEIDRSGMELDRNGRWDTVGMESRQAFY